MVTNRPITYQDTKRAAIAQGPAPFQIFSDVGTQGAQGEGPNALGARHLGPISICNLAQFTRQRDRCKVLGPRQLGEGVGRSADRADVRIPKAPRPTTGFFDFDIRLLVPRKIFAEFF